MLNNREERDSLIGAGLGIGLTLSTVVLTGIALGQHIKGMGPAVGDVIAFHTAGPLLGDFDEDVHAFEAKPGGAACVLPVRSMIADGSSIIVEAIDANGPAKYRVHWAGGRSSSATCPKDSDLFVSREGLLTLAAAAGGFGVDKAVKPEVMLQTAFARGQ